MEFYTLSVPILFGCKLVHLQAQGEQKDSAAPLFFQKEDWNFQEQSRDPDRFQHPSPLLHKNQNSPLV